MMCASIMIFLFIEVIQFSMVDIINCINGHSLPLKLDSLLYTVIVIGIIIKLSLFIICSYINLTARNDMLVALAEDHFNDILSNSGAIITASIAYNTTAWWLDPGGAILISIIIISRWVWIITDQVKKVLGRTAPPDFIIKIERIVRLHHPRLAVDCTRVYHFGAKYNVEIEIILPGSMTVIDSHGIALALKQKIETIDDIERVFIHIDYQQRDTLSTIDCS
jgi:divalent metal cation (Fe/Co/Zn/Cd) transporter